MNLEKNFTLGKKRKKMKSGKPKSKTRIKNKTMKIKSVEKIKIKEHL